ncbi:MAG: alpha-ketoacid dehydrogenase subunit beta [Deltaproteobacteria bacterium]|nr:alpha-ketoacid dehydrogenase subunit beta [Deltaproteobacteria bacterium]
MPVQRIRPFFQAINEAIAQCMADDPYVYIIGLGVPDPKGIFGTTLGLVEKFGPKRVMDMPTSENAMTGIAIGSAIVGMRPIMTHQRIDFALLALDQIVNQAANWHYMFGGQMHAPLVIRMIIGRGWGQGPQHSQSLQNWFAHIPGLKVVMPTTPYDAKGLLITSIEDNNPVIFLEHRWLYHIKGHVPEEIYRVPLGQASVIRQGKDVTIVSTSHMTLEALRASQLLEKEGVRTEIIDVRTLKPLDQATILESVRKTGRLVVADTGWRFCGYSAEIIACVTENLFDELKSPPIRIGLPDCPSPTSPALSRYYYPGANEIINAALKSVGRKTNKETMYIKPTKPHDIPDADFTGPF